MNDRTNFLKVCPFGRLLALDVGEKTIGMALSDTTRLVARPLGTFARKKWTTDGHRLAQEIQTSQATGLVIGWPLNMDGTLGPRCQSTRNFAENMWALAPYPTLFWDERLSTCAVTKTLLSADVSRQKRARVVDKLAACYILQGALGALGRVPGASEGTFPL